MSQFGYYFERYLTARAAVIDNQPGPVIRESLETMNQCLDGMERCIGDEIERQITDRLRDLRLIPVGGDEE